MNNQKLFSYGTLRYEPVQMSTFGRKLEGKNDILNGFKLSMVRITDPEVIATSGETEHPILNYTGDKNDSVEGMVFDVSLDEIKQADEYEVDDYKRISVLLKSGFNAWVYVKAD